MLFFKSVLEIPQINAFLYQCIIDQISESFWIIIRIIVISFLQKNYYRTVHRMNPYICSVIFKILIKICVKDNTISSQVVIFIMYLLANQATTPCFGFKVNVSICSRAPCTVLKKRITYIQVQKLIFTNFFLFWQLTKDLLSYIFQSIHEVVVLSIVFVNLWKMNF